MTYHLGIDAGTTYTAAAVYRDEQVEIVSLGDRAASIPSVIFLKDNGSVLTGDAAYRRGLAEPERVAFQFKRRVGDATSILLGGTPYSAEALMAKLIRWTVDKVAELEGGPPDRVALTHPANWGDYKLDRLDQAIRMADLNGAVTLTEPEAAAIHYASNERVEPDSTIAVYDLGGGTFDVAILRKNPSGWSILGSPEGIEQLGGVDVDEAVYEHVRRAVPDAFENLDPSDAAVRAAITRLRRECVEAKEALSSDTDVNIAVLLPSTQTQVRLTRAELESRIGPTLEDTVGAMERALRSADVGPADVTAVLLVGGSSRIPMVAELVSRAYGRPIAVDAHPKHAIALGAALAAAGKLDPRLSGAPIAVVHTEETTEDPLPPPPPEPGAPEALPPPHEPPALSREPEAIPEPEPVGPAGDGDAGGNGTRPNRLLIGGVAALLLATVVGGIVAFSGGGGDDDDVRPEGPVQELPASAEPLANDTLTFASRQNNNMDIWMMRGSDGTDKERLVNVPGVDDYLPALSPDRRSVAYSRVRGLQSELHIVAADGTGDLVVMSDLSPDARPSWSPDGTQLVFASQVDGQTDLYSATIELSENSPRLGELVRLTDSPATEADPAWSPDGDKVVYWSNETGNQNLHWISPDGDGEQHPITDGAFTDADPTWAPDGRLAFTRTTEDAASDIYVVELNRAGEPVSEPVNLTDDLHGPNEDATWAPDGSSIAFSHRDPGLEPDIWVMTDTGENKLQITDNPDWDGHPAWGGVHVDGAGSIDSPSPVTVTVAVAGTDYWTDTGFPCTQGQELSIAASGTVIHDTDDPDSAVGPDGIADPSFRQFGLNGAPPDANAVALLGSVERIEPFFLVGSEAAVACPATGVLFLGVNDIGVENNSGEFTAVISGR